MPVQLDLLNELPPEGSLKPNYSKRERVLKHDKEHLVRISNDRAENVKQQLEKVHTVDPKGLLGNPKGTTMAEKQLEYRPLGEQHAVRKVAVGQQFVPSPPNNKARKRERKSPASRIYKNRIDPNTSALYEAKRAGQSSRLLKRMGGRKKGSVSGNPIPLRAQQQYLGYLNSGGVYSSEYNMPFLQATVEAHGHNDNASVASSEASNYTLSMGNGELNRISAVAQYKFGIYKKVGASEQTEDQLEETKFSLKEEDFSRRKHSKGRSRRRRKRHAKKRQPGLSIGKMDMSRSPVTTDSQHSHVDWDEGRSSLLRRTHRDISAVLGQDFAKQQFEFAGDTGAQKEKKSDEGIAKPPQGSGALLKVLETSPELSSVTNLKKPHFHALSKSFSTVSVTKGTVICLKNEPGLYIVKEGVATIATTNTLLEENNYFGANSLFSDLDINVSATSATLVLWKLPRLQYHAVMYGLGQGQTATESQTKRQMPAFLSGFPAEILDSIEKHIKGKIYKPGTVLVQGGNRIKTITTVLSGELSYKFHNSSDVSHAANMKNCLRAGDNVGFGEVLSRDEASIAEGDIVADSDVAVIEFDINGVPGDCPSRGALKELCLHFSKIELLRKVELFKTFPIAKLGALAEQCMYLDYKPNKKIIREGDIGRHMYIIRKGEVKFERYRKGIPDTLGHLFTNDFFGEGSIVTQNTRRCSAVALVHTFCLELPGKAVKEAFGAGLQSSLGRTFLVRQQVEMEDHEHLFEFKDIVPIRKIGKGAFGRVILVRHTITGKTFALKELDKNYIESSGTGLHVQRERIILSKLKYHPFLCNLVRTFNVSNMVYFMMDPVLGGDLYSHLRRFGKFPEKTCRFYASQMVSMLQYLHKENIIFRDLKPENLLLEQTGYLKLVDFGLSKIVTPNSETYTMCGTPTHLAPEVYFGKGYGKSVDWWSLGVVMHEMLNGYVPFVGSSPEAIFSEICRYSKVYPNVSFPNHVSAPGVDLLTRLLNPSAAARIGTGVNDNMKLLNHSFFGKSFSWADLIAQRIRPKFIPDVMDMYDTTNFDGGPEEFILPVPDATTTIDPQWCRDF
eukprot:g8618.t1